MRGCTFPDCAGVHKAKGWCGAHYVQANSGREMVPIRIKYPPDCAFDECSRKPVSYGLCGAHTMQRRRGQPLKKTRGPGKGFADANGYRITYRPDSVLSTRNGWVRENRHVVAEHLGRNLLPEENVHHINGDRADNRIDNLELWSKAQPAGQRVEDKLRWAAELIKQYHQEYPEIVSALFNYLKAI